MNNKTVAEELDKNIDCCWRPDFQRDEEWKKQGIIVVFISIKTKEECKGLIKDIDSAIAVKFFGAIDFSSDTFDVFFENDLDKINFTFYGTHNPVFFVSRENVEVRKSKPILKADGDIDFDYSGELWLKNTSKWIAPDNDKDFYRSALLLNAYEDNDSDDYIFFFSHNIKNLVEFDVISNIPNEGVFCKGVVFNVADLITITDDKTVDLFSEVS